MKNFFILMLLLITVNCFSQSKGQFIRNDTLFMLNGGIETPILNQSQVQTVVADSSKYQNTLSIGTRIATAPLTVTNFNTDFPIPQTGTMFHLVSDASVNGRLSFDTYNNISFTGAIFQGRRGRGTAAVPLPPVADDVLVAIGADGYGTSSFTGASVGSVNIRSAETFTNISKPTYISFTTTPTGSFTQLERVQIKSTGALKFNDYGTGFFTGTPAYSLQVDASGNIIEGGLSGNTSFGSLTGVYSDNASLVTAFASKQDAGNYAFGGGTATGTNTGDNAINNLYSGLAASKQNTITTGTTAQYFKGDLSLGTYAGYSINVQALTSSPVDAQTIYFGMLPKAPTTTANISKIYIRQAGTIKRAEIYCYSGTAGTNEAWVMNIRLNNTTDTQIASVAVATNERVFSNTGLSIAVNAGDYVEIKAVNPTWVTNPLTTIIGGYLYIE